MSAVGGTDGCVSAQAARYLCVIVLLHLSWYPLWSVPVCLLFSAYLHWSVPVVTVPVCVTCLLHWRGFRCTPELRSLGPGLAHSRPSFSHKLSFSFVLPPSFTSCVRCNYTEYTHSRKSRNLSMVTSVALAPGYIPIVPQLPLPCIISSCLYYSYSAYSTRVFKVLCKVLVMYT